MFTPPYIRYLISLGLRERKYSRLVWVSIKYHLSPSLLEKTTCLMFIIYFDLFLQIYQQFLLNTNKKPSFFNEGMFKN